MKSNIMFAVDTSKEEIIVSASPKGSNKIDFIERIGRHDNAVLYDAVVALTSITKAPNFDIAIFNAMEKVCQMVYKKHKETTP